MQSPVIHIHITGMVHIHHLRLVAINTLFNTLDQVETIQGIEAIVREIKQLNTCCPKYRSGCLCRLRQGGELISGLQAIGLLLAGGSPFCHD